MKLTKTQWIIVVVIGLIAVWYFFLRKKPVESNFKATIPTKGANQTEGGGSTVKTAGTGSGTVSRTIRPVAPVGCPSGQAKCKQVGPGAWEFDESGTTCCAQTS